MISFASLGRIKKDITMADSSVMADHFEKSQKLPDPIPRSHNFRKVPRTRIQGLLLQPAH